MIRAKIKTYIALLIGTILVLLMSALIFSLYTISHLKSNLQIQTHTRTIVITLEANLNYLLEAETGERGFIITADTNYLEYYKMALQNIDVNTKQLRILTQDDPLQQENLDTLEKYINLKLARLKMLVSLKKKAEEETIKEMLAYDPGKILMDRIRAVNKSMQARELLLYEGRKANTFKSIENAKIIFITEGIFSLLITILLGFIIVNELNRREKIEKELTVASDRFYKLFNESPIAMSISEIGTNKIVLANTLFYKSFGYSEEEVIGHTSQELKLISPEEEAKLMTILLGYINETRSVAELRALPAAENEKLIMKLKQSMGDKGLEVLYTRKNGETFYVILNYGLIELDNKKYTVTSYQDISEQKKAENDVITYSRELEMKNKEIEQFAYIASHDLQEPLRTISNFSGLLAQSVETHHNSEEQKYLGHILGGIKRMSQLILDVLEYSRIGKDKTKTLIDCDKLVREILTDMDTSIKESGAEIHVKKLPVVNGFIYLKSLFQNLISNAIKFRKKGVQPVIEISSTDKGKEFLFSVKDNGIGIDKIYHEKIFLIFQRLHNRTEYEGTGIGLSQCKKIVELHGGRIWVESEIEKGSTFYFTIPKT